MISNLTKPLFECLPEKQFFLVVVWIPLLMYFTVFQISNFRFRLFYFWLRLLIVYFERNKIETKKCSFVLWALSVCIFFFYYSYYRIKVGNLTKFKNFSFSKKFMKEVIYWNFWIIKTSLYIKSTIIRICRSYE